MSPEDKSESMADTTPSRTRAGGEVIARTLHLMGIVNKPDNGEVPAKDYDPSTDTEVTDTHRLAT